MGIDKINRGHEIEDNINALEHRLTAWRPALGALDRDRMLYEAGWSAARADGHIQAWRLATAALLLLLIGLSGLHARQSSLLAREGALLARERSKRTALETTLAAQTLALPAEPAHPRGEALPIEPFAPTSYFALASRHAHGIADASWPDADTPTEEHQPDRGPPDKLPVPTPLRPRDLQRVLDL
jgi:hypothetical protein